MSIGNKLLNLREYHRPAETGGGLAAALALLARPGIRTVPLGGGDTLLAEGDPTVEAVVDLQGLGLDVLAEEAHGHGRLRIGALVTRSALAEASVVREHVAGLLVEAARRWGGNVQRNRATVGGALATAASDDPLVAALLVSDALVLLVSAAGERAVPVADFLAQRAAALAAPAIITGVIVPYAASATGAALATVGRTPADAPIVLAAAVLTVAGDRCNHARLALGGVAAAPMRLPAVEAMLAGQALTADLIAQAAAHAAELVHPAGDFRGSAEYRKAMAGVLSERALREAWGRTMTSNE